MRRLFFALLLVLSLQTHAQVQIRNLSLTDSTLLYLYIGLDNMIEIEWDGLKPEEHKISISGGGASITKYSPNRYVVKVTTITDDCHIRITGEKGKQRLDNIYKVREIKTPYVSLGGLMDRSATKSRILANPILTFTNPDCYYRYKIQIVSFTVTVDIKGNIMEAMATGNQLNERQIELIKDADDLLTIDNIRASSPDGRVMRLPSIVIYIKKDELQDNP